MRLADDQFNLLIAALTPITARITALETETARLEDDKANLTGEINIEGEVDGVPAEISGIYEIVDLGSITPSNVPPMPPIPRRRRTARLWHT